VNAGPGPRRARNDVAEAVLRGRLLFSSYAPLNAILAALIEDDVRYLFALLAILGFLDAYRLTWWASRVARVPRTFREVKDAGGEVAGYLATYLLPFLAAPHADAGDLVGYAIYAVVVVVVTLRSNLGAVNPAIYLFGWKIATVTLQDGRERYLVCRRTPPPGEVVHVANLYGVLHARD
jgi:hypothetical protein